MRTKIFINAAPGLLERINISNVEFLALEKASQLCVQDSVAVIARDQAFEENLARVCRLGMPVVALAGSLSTTEREPYQEAHQQAYQEALSWGVQEAGIIYKTGSRLCNHGGHRFSSSVQNGVGPAAILEVAQYALKNKLMCDMIVLWQPEEHILAENAETVSSPKPANYKSKAVQEKIVKGNKGCKQHGQKAAGSVRQVGLSDLLEQSCRTVLAVRTAANTRGSRVAAALANRYDALHLEISSHPCSYGAHGADSFEEAIDSCNYAYSDGCLVSVSGGGATVNRPLIIEMEPHEMPPALLDELHGKADCVIHLSDFFEDCGELIDDWIAAGGRLDAIIPENDQEKAVYEERYPGLVADVDGLAFLFAPG